MTDRTTRPKGDLRQEITNQIITALEKGTTPWQKPWRVGALELPFNPTSAKAYRGGNAIHLMLTATARGYEDPRWLTYRQAQEKGWQVRKGESGTHVEFWQFPERSQNNSDEFSDPGQSQSDKFIYRVYTVFNARQIDGIPMHSPRIRQEWEIVQSAEAILHSSGVGIRHDQQDRAFYSRLSDTIHLPPKSAFRRAADFYGTALHEAAHATGHPQRLNRETLNESYRFGDLNYAREELRAELTSVFLMAEKGIPHDTSRHAAYVGSWLEALRKDKHEIFRAARDAHKAADLLLVLEHCPSLDQALAKVRQNEASRFPSPEIVSDRTTPEKTYGPGLASVIRPPVVEIEL
jgi:antirestriction protein ArdC